MNNQSIILEIDGEGEVRAEGCGFKGPACEKAMKEILDALGPIEKSTKKPDWYQSDSVTHKQRA